VRRVFLSGTIAAALLGGASQAQAGYWWASGSCAYYREVCLSNPKNPPKGCEVLYQRAMASGDEYTGYFLGHWNCSKK